MPDTSRQRVSAIASCQHCAWSAIMHGDDAFDVATFLHQRQRAHIFTAHPDVLLHVETGNALWSAILGSVRTQDYAPVAPVSR